jgi:hypothetical protein
MSDAETQLHASVSVKIYLGVILVALFPVCVFTVLYYAEPGFPYRTYVTLVLGYYATFGILLVVPIDIAAVVFDRLSTEVGDSPQYDADRRLLSDVYNTFFTMVLIMGSVVLVLEEYFNSDGKPRSLLSKLAPISTSLHIANRLLHRRV